MITQKAPGVVFGLEVAEETFRQLDPEIEFERLVEEGRWRERRARCSALEGSARAILTGERTALNFLQRLSGVATVTARHVRAVEGTGARILDTRKTTPGAARAREGGGRRGRCNQPSRRAVRRDPDQGEPRGDRGGGGRGGAQRRGGGAGAARSRSNAERRGGRSRRSRRGRRRILLDNMTPEQLRAAVERVAGRAELEASGGVTLETLPEIARTGVQFISVGALTHSARALDLSLILEPLP